MEAFLPTLLLSLRLAFWTALLLLPLAGGLAWLLRRPVPGRAFLEALTLLPLTLPPTVLGFYFLVLFGEGGPLARLGLRLAFTFEGLVVASVLFNLPLAFNTYREVFRALDPDLLETARTLGAGPFKRWTRVVLPLTWPGLLSGTLLAFAHTLGEFGVALMVGGSLPGVTKVASIQLFELTESLRLAEAHRLAFLLLLLGLSVALLVRLLEERWRSGTAS